MARIGREDEIKDRDTEKVDHKNYIYFCSREASVGVNYMTDEKEESLSKKQNRSVKNV